MPKFPGYKNKSPGKGFEWRGSSSPEDNKGNWYNPKTKESYHWDLNHAGPMKPHWDYINPNGWENGYRIYDTYYFIIPILFEMEMLPLCHSI